MGHRLKLDQVLVHSSDVVCREIDGDVIIVPLTARVADVEDELFSLSDTGRAVWLLLDGGRTLGEVVDLLMKEYDTFSCDEIETDVLGFAQELVDRGILAVKT